MRNNPLNILQIIECFEVGPVKIEPTRISALYKFTQNSKVESNELIYRYEEKVFNPNDANDQNLASLITAQVAINYGLFCRKMIFHGLFEDADRRFIMDMMENTAREIFVKKFLEPNPFLKGEAANLSPFKSNRYLNANLDFPQVYTVKKKVPWQLWSTYRHKHAILSSGGKDSLLSYGLLNEVGKDVHPMFINESGRHWYTALNAYRFFKKKIPNTCRVWTNADRIFNWMLRHFPFIRQDFARIRSDEYPIRLWTVAVFLFGALPLIRKRGIGRLVIGDEFDTTDKSVFKGITHYNGLYDQSRYFDNTLSRYFLRKGWAISQFSVLRPLSELLIEKILVKRYPYLQALQMSCHAAHVDVKKVLPCGKCEKCRRIVGMLKAIDADPRHCGYTGQQIQKALNDLEKKGLHQEAAGRNQLFYLLSKKGMINLNTSFKVRIREHPEILKLRFDPEKSPVNSIPIDLRDAIFRICLKYASGAVKRIGRKWIEIDILNHSEFYASYPFETSILNNRKLQNGRHTTVTSQTDYLFGELTWPEVEERLRKIDVAILPVGAIEQHGPHLPLDTDAFDAEYLAKQVAAACSNPKPLVLPTISYGISYHHEDFKGTISISNETLSKMVYEIGMSAARNGINKLVIINGHGGNSPSLNFAAQMINRDARIFACVDTGETSDVDIYGLVETPNDVHAGEFETSTSLAIRPQLVKMEKAKKMVPEFSSRYLNFTSKRGISWYAHTKKISTNGIIGDPTKASAEKGEKMWKIMIAHLVAFIEDLKRMSLNEIYQRRY